jgi:putative membrane protein
MMLRWLLAALHLLGLGIGLGAVVSRARALRGVLDHGGIRRALQADSWWAVAAAVWIVTGLLRAFAGFEKGTSYYLHNHLFLTKMGALALILLLEIRPIALLPRWRRAVARGEQPDTWPATAIARTSLVQAGLVVLMVFLATGMARGYGSTGP